MAFPAKERRELLARDNNTSQLLYYNEELGWHNTPLHCKIEGIGCTRLEAHHIEPSRYGGANEIINGIILFACQHVGRCQDQQIKRGYDMTEKTENGYKPKPGKWLNPEKAFVVHPDIQQALMNYNPSKTSLADVFAQRNVQVEEGTPYWNTDHDEQFKQTAWERSHNPGWWLNLDDEFTYGGDMSRQIDMMEEK